MEELKWAIQNGDLDKVKEITNKPGFDVNAVLTNSTGRRALHVAADYGQEEVLKHLLELQNVDVNILDQNDITPMLATIWEGHTPCVKLLLQKGAKVKDMKAPGGNSYTDCAEKEEIREMLKGAIKD